MAQFNDLTEEDRHNLADIAWFIEGFNHAEKSPFGDAHVRTLNKTIEAIRELTIQNNDKIRT